MAHSSLLEQLAQAEPRVARSEATLAHHGRGPRASINHVTVHDGFTLSDLSSYERKHNQANGENNSDGSDVNFSTNCGMEGPTHDPTIREQRRLLRRNLLASFLLAQGVPLWAGMKWGIVSNATTMPIVRITRPAG